MPLGLCNVGICVLELVFIAKQHRQGGIDPKQLFAPVECGLTVVDDQRKNVSRQKILDCA